MDDICAPLAKEDVVAAIERKNPCRIPMVMAKWWGEGLWEQYGERLSYFNRYPDDVAMLWAGIASADTSRLSWYRPGETAKRGYDARCLLPDWKYLDEFIEKMPDPEAPGLFDPIYQAAEDARRDNRYLIFCAWGLFFERPWGIRGMENLMIDYYEHPDMVHRLHDALCAQYEKLILRAAREIQPDGFWTSDDLGHQTQLMMKPAHFKELLKPYYARIGKVCRETNMHFWLHSCGNNTDAMEDLIEAGVDVFHPVQKHTMDERTIARQFGEQITFLAGFDVQHVLVEGSPEEVRAEVRFLIDTFDRPGGGMCMASGNGIVSGTPFENIDAFLDESIRYGAEHRSRQAAN
ncbi:MAG: methylcobamide--CoM methyltransferase [Armatimonadetes bacterium]|nr:methylcobamide--CoM methyltransferase [Armatimonadota bacterium]